jgi:hypothetical protein
VGHTITRATIIWFVGATVVGAAAGTLHLVRSAIDSPVDQWLAIATYVLVALAALMTYRGIMVAASEQDAATSRSDVRSAAPRRTPE